MPRVTDPEIRWRLSATFKRAQNIEGFGPFRLRDLDNLLGHARLAKVDARRDTAKHLSPLFSIAYAHLAVLSEMALAMIIQEEEPLPADWLPPPSQSNLILRSNLLQLANHGLAILGLVERGLANSARSLLRTLIEATWVTVIFCGKRDKAQQYAMGTDFQLAKDIWQRHFSPKAMKASLSEIERRFKWGEDITEYLQEHRAHIYQLHTQSAHNTSSVLGILSFDSDLADESNEPAFYPALHGRVGLASKATLEDTIDVLGYAVLMLFLLFRTVHGHIVSDRKSLWAGSQTLALGSLGIWFGARGFKPVGRMWGESSDDPDSPGSEA